MRRNCITVTWQSGARVQQQRSLVVTLLVEVYDHNRQIYSRKADSALTIGKAVDSGDST